MTESTAEAARCEAEDHVDHEQAPTANYFYEGKPDRSGAVVGVGSLSVLAAIEAIADPSQLDQN